MMKLYTVGHSKSCNPSEAVEDQSGHLHLQDIESKVDKLYKWLICIHAFYKMICVEPEHRQHEAKMLWAAK